MAPGGAGREEHEEPGEESAEVTQAINSFMAPRQSPATDRAGRVPGAGSTRPTVAPVDATSWKELGPYAYYPDNRRLPVAALLELGLGLGLQHGPHHGHRVAPDGAVYAGGAGGGVWKSTRRCPPAVDAAVRQARHDGDRHASPWSRTPPARGYTVYAGTGEPTINLDSYAGVGVLASTDAGASWHRVGGDELQGAGIFKIAATPDAKTLFAATSKGLYRFRSGVDTLEAQVVGDPDSGAVAERPGAQPDVGRGRPARARAARRSWPSAAGARARPTNGLYVSRDGGDTFKGPLAPQGYVPR